MPYDISQEQRRRKPTRVQLLVFAVGDYDFALILQESAMTKTILEGVSPYEPTVRVPNTPEFIKGVANYKGKLVLVVDLGTILGIPLKRETEGKFILLDLEEEMRAFLVDDVVNTLWVNDAEIEFKSVFSIGDKQIPLVAATVNAEDKVLPIIDPYLIFEKGIFSDGKSLDY
jgi:purine-binding chemotaxis protein CheW